MGLELNSIKSHWSEKICVLSQIWWNLTYTLLLLRFRSMPPPSTHTHTHARTHTHKRTHTKAHTQTQIYTYIHTNILDAAWWPAILKGLRDAKCPKNLYQLTQDYFRGRRAVVSINSCKMEKNITKGCPQGSCCGPGFWNIQLPS